MAHIPAGNKTVHNRTGETRLTRTVKQARQIAACRVNSCNEKKKHVNKKKKDDAILHL